MDWWKTPIPGKVFAIPALTVLASLVVLWTVGLYAPMPRFRVDPADPGRVVPIHWPWWRRAGDWLHGRRYIVLSFDDGPAGGGIDRSILQTLRNHHAKAMFFLVCAHITPSRVSVPDEILRQGSLVADHSFTHPHLPRLHGARLRHQIQGCSRFLNAVDGRLPHYFRPPFGDVTPAVDRAIRAAGLRRVMWGSNSFDVVWRKPSRIRRWALKEAYNDSILLMHSRARTARALPAILDGLRHEGYRFVLPVRVPSVAATVVKRVGS